MAILQVLNLTKQFPAGKGQFKAIDNISFELKEGEILGLLGPNGAGKTTTIQMLLGVLKPTMGKIVYFGKDFNSGRDEILEKVNFSSTYTNLPWDLTVWENLNFISYLYDIKNRYNRIERVINIFKLKDLRHKKMYELSAGQLTRANLAKAFINFPRVLLLDEQTASLDPDVASYIREFLLYEQDKFQVSIIITSHNMAEVEEVCDLVIFINRGKIIADNTPENLAKSIEVCHVELMVKDGLKRLIEFCQTNVVNFELEGRFITIDIKECEVAEFLRKIMDLGVFYDEISIQKPSLEDYFLQVAKKSL